MANQTIMIDLTVDSISDEESILLPPLLPRNSYDIFKQENNLSEESAIVKWKELNFYEQLEYDFKSDYEYKAYKIKLRSYNDELKHQDRLIKIHNRNQIIDLRNELKQQKEIDKNNKLNEQKEALIQQLQKNVDHSATLPNGDPIIHERNIRKKVWESLFLGIDEAMCPLCNSSKIKFMGNGNTFQKAHIIAKSKKGINHSSNMLPSCGCNQQMGTKHLVFWMATDGNKRPLLLNVFLKKYKSLIPPAFRNNTDVNQVVNFVKLWYNPPDFDSYKIWLVLSQKHLNEIFD